MVRSYTVWRQEESNRWDAELLSDMKGTPKQPDPSRGGIQIPIKVRFDGPDPVEPVETVPARAGFDIRRMRVS